MGSPAVSVIVNTYNRAHALRNCLMALERQTRTDFEVVVADDGSSDGTDEVVRSFAKSAPFPVRHVWHEDLGHRRAAILNRGIADCRSDYVLFTDCDAIARRDLVEVHLRHRMPRRMLCGGYHRLTREETESLDPEAVRNGAAERIPMGWGRTRRLYWQSLKHNWYILVRKRNRPRNMGLNYSVALADLLAVNGYDEEFRGWGHADGDVRRRLRMIGVQPKSVWTKAIVYHQWHPTETTKTGEIRSRNRAYARRSDVSAFCANGIAKGTAARTAS